MSEALYCFYERTLCMANRMQTANVASPVHVSLGCLLRKLAISERGYLKGIAVTHTPRTAPKKLVVKGWRS